METYRQGRQALLASIFTTLAADERVVAAWLTGSYARGDDDAVSDIDLTVVIANAPGESLCRRGDMVTANPPAERLAFFSRFGQPANVHENNHNAPAGGTFTGVLYRPAAHVVDWTLVPHSLAQRPASARLLFERAAIPLAPPPEPADPALLAAQVAEWVAFFWMMAAVTAKYLARRDLLFVQCRLEELGQLVRHVERSLTGQVYEHPARRPQAISLSPEDVRVALEGLCDHMERQMALAGGIGISLRPAPRDEIATLLRLDVALK